MVRWATSDERVSSGATAFRMYAEVVQEVGYELSRAIMKDFLFPHSQDHYSTLVTVRAALEPHRPNAFIAMAPYFVDDNGYAVCGGYMWRSYDEIITYEQGWHFLIE